MNSFVFPSTEVTVTYSFFLLREVLNHITPIKSALNYDTLNKNCFCKTQIKCKSVRACGCQHSKQHGKAEKIISRYWKTITWFSKEIAHLLQLLHFLSSLISINKSLPQLGTMLSIRAAKLHQHTAANMSRAVKGNWKQWEFGKTCD